MPGRRRLPRRLEFIRSFYGFRLAGKIPFNQFRDQQYGLRDAIGVVGLRCPDGLGCPVFCVVDSTAASLPPAVNCVLVENGDHPFDWAGRANKFFARFHLTLRAARAGRGQAEDPDESNSIAKLHEELSQLYRLDPRAESRVPQTEELTAFREAPMQIAYER